MGQDNGVEYSERKTRGVGQKDREMPPNQVMSPLQAMEWTWGIIASVRESHWELLGIFMENNSDIVYNDHFYYCMENRL